MQIVANIALALLKSYLIKLATTEFADYVLRQVVMAIVKNTETLHDDEFAQKVFDLVDGKK